MGRPTPPARRHEVVGSIAEPALDQIRVRKHAPMNADRDIDAFLNKIDISAGDDAPTDAERIWPHLMMRPESAG